MTKYHFHYQSGIDAMQFAIAALNCGFSVSVLGDGGEWETVTLTDTDWATDLYWAPMPGGAVPVGHGGEWEIMAENVAKIA